MSFKRFVETGRVAYIVDGENRGKLCTVVDIIDQTRVLVDGPNTGVPRQGIRINQISLTKFRMKIPRTGGTRVVRKSWRAAKIDERWRKSIWAKNLVKKKKRLAMTDFDRFKLKGAISKRNKIRSEAFFVLRKRAIRKNALYGMKKRKKSQRERDSAKAKAHARGKIRAYKKAKLIEKGLLKPKERREKPKKKPDPKGDKPKEKPGAKTEKPKGKPVAKAEKPKGKPEAKAEKPKGKPVAKTEKPKAKPAPKK